MKVTEKQLQVMLRVLEGSLSIADRSDMMMFGFDRDTRKNIYNQIINQQSNAVVDVKAASESESKYSCKTEYVKKCTQDGHVLLCVNEDFSHYPGPRYRSEGTCTGEEFYENFLLPAFTEAKKIEKKLILDLDRVNGYGSAFLDEVFTRLSKEFGFDQTWKRLVFRSNEEPYLIGEIKEYLKDA